LLVFHEGRDWAFTPFPVLGLGCGRGLAKWTAPPPGCARCLRSVLPIFFFLRRRNLHHSPPSFHPGGREQGRVLPLPCSAKDPFPANYVVSPFALAGAFFRERSAAYLYQGDPPTTAFSLAPDASFFSVALAAFQEEIPPPPRKVPFSPPHFTPRHASPIQR